MPLCDALHRESLVAMKRIDKVSISNTHQISKMRKNLYLKALFEKISQITQIKYQNLRFFKILILDS